MTCGKKKHQLYFVLLLLTRGRRGGGLEGCGNVDCQPPGSIWKSPTIIIDLED